MHTAGPVYGNRNLVHLLVQQNFFLWFVAFIIYELVFAHLLFLIPLPGFCPWLSLPVRPSCSIFTFLLMSRSCKTVFILCVLCLSNAGLMCSAFPSTPLEFAGFVIFRDFFVWVLCFTNIGFVQCFSLNSL